MNVKNHTMTQAQIAAQIEARREGQRRKLASHPRRRNVRSEPMLNQTTLKIPVRRKRRTRPR